MSEHPNRPRKIRFHLVVIASPAEEQGLWEAIGKVITSSNAELVELSRATENEVNTDA